MEIGSFRGYTAFHLLNNLPADTLLVTVDRDPGHGEAYLNTNLATRAERRIGEIGTGTFVKDQIGSYDLIFVDAGHSYEGVKHDIELVLPLLAENGLLVWHDYANWG